MDREIPLKERRRKRLIMWGKVAAVVLVVAGAVVWFTDFSRSEVKRSSLQIAKADRGTIETTVSASGKVSPLIEELVTSPISSRILEVYHCSGDSVSEGEPLMLLDLTTVKNELQALLDQQKIKLESLRQQRINAANSLKELEMRLEVKQMTVAQLRRDLDNEIYLDSLGSGTGENVMRAENLWRIADMELRQMQQELVTRRDFNAADIHTRELELEIFNRDLEAKRRMLTDAHILSPRNAVVTQIVNTIGQRVSSGDQVAVVADLAHYKVEAEISDTYGDKVANGSRAVIRIGKAEIPAVVSDLSPVSKGGVLSFTARPDSDGDPRLRSGLRADVYVVTNVIDDVVRIPNGPFYTNGPGAYDLFVVNSDSTQLEKRTVTLGQANYEWVEVISGISPGEQIVISDMSAYKRNHSLKVKN